MIAKRKRPEDTKVLTLRLQQERDDLEKNMTLRRERKKESLTKKLLEHERFVILFVTCILFFSILGFLIKVRFRQVTSCDMYCTNLKLKKNI